MEILQSANDQLAIVLAERFLEDYKSQGERIGSLPSVGAWVEINL